MPQVSSSILESFKGYKYRLLFLLAGGYLVSNLNIQGIQALMPFIQSEFGISRTMAGLYTTVLFTAATMIAIFSGNLVDKIGARRGVLIGIFSIGLLIFVHVPAPFYGVLLILAFPMGIGFSIITPSINKALMLKVRAEKRAVSMGIMHSGGGIGGIAGASLLPILASNFSWRVSLLFSGTVALLVGMMVFKHLDMGDDSPAEDESAAGGGLFVNIREIISNKGLITTCLLGFSFGLTFGAVPAHYTLFLTLDLDYTAVVAGLALGLMQFGGLFGRIFWGWISDKLLQGNRPRTFMMMIFSTASLMLFNAFAGSILKSYTAVVMISSLLLGATVVGWSGIFFTVIGEKAGPDKVGLASGVSLVFARTGIVIGPPLFGMLGDYFDHYHFSWFLFALLISSIGLTYFILNKRLAAE